MSINFVNGSTVYRCWKSDSEGELLGAFQCFYHAIYFAQAVVKEQNDGCSIVAIDHSEGRLKRFFPTPDTAEGDG